MSDKMILDALETVEEREVLPVGEVIIGSLTGLGQAGEPLVDHVFNRKADSVSAISTVSLTNRHVGRKVVLMFVDGDLNKPLIIGLVYSPLQEIIENFELAAVRPDAPPNEMKSSQDVGIYNSDTDMHVDGRKVLVEAKEEVILKCGEASITLSKSGKISIRGKYILNRATGVNRILGGSVQVN